jgi:hypothetical protein
MALEEQRHPGADLENLVEAIAKLQRALMDGDAS